MENLTEIIGKVVIASFATIGLIEYLKNFIKTEKTWIYSLIMPFVAILCFIACVYLPPVVIGCILTIGTTQVDYQIIIQTFKNLITKKKEE